MTDIVLKFNEAQQAVDELNAEAAKLEELTAEEGALVDQIAGSEWTGSGEGSWEQRQREWQKESVEESAALRRLVQSGARPRAAAGVVAALTGTRPNELDRELTGREPRR